MLVFWKENLAVLMVPKTGTTALQGALAPRASLVLRDPPELKHAPVYRWRRFFRPLFNQGAGREPELAAVVRHPVDWLGSWYRYRYRDDLVGQPNSTRDISFDAFVAEYLKGKPASYAAVGSQAKFLLDGDGQLGVDHLFRYEAAPGLIGFLEVRLGQQIQTKPLNVSPRMDLTLSPQIEAKLREKRAEEFRVWEIGQA